ncbi:hypothetical protein Tco_0335465 [Tanacetum coccineum]
MSAKNTLAIQRCELSRKELDEFLSFYPIPSEYRVILPTSTQTILDAPPGYIGLYTHCFSLANLRLPLNDFFCEYCDKHNQVGFLRKPDESAGFAEIVDFLRGSNLRYALTTNPTIYDSLLKQFWQTATANTNAEGTLEIKATIDTISYTISEASIRDSLQLNDATGITMLPNDELFEGMGQIGYPTDGTFTFWKSFFTPQWRYLVHHLLHCISSKSGGWDQFGSNIATALVCLSTGRVYNFSKLIFDGMVANLKSKTKFLMYPRFLQMILNIQTENKHLYLAVSLTKKIFGNMKRGFRGAPRPLLPSMLLVATNPNAGQEHDVVAPSQPSSSTPQGGRGAGRRGGRRGAGRGAGGDGAVDGVCGRGRDVVLSDSEEEEPEAQGRKSQVVESFAPINFEATKASLKRFGEELQAKTSKRLKSDEAKDDEPTKKSGKRRKHMARKGLHTNLDKDDSEGSG